MEVETEIGQKLKEIKIKRKTRKEEFKREKEKNLACPESFQYSLIVIYF